MKNATRVEARHCPGDVRRGWKIVRRIFDAWARRDLETMLETTRAASHHSATRRTAVTNPGRPIPSLAMAAGTRYLALLRGINVGGKNPLRMAELRASFEDAGFKKVRTYIQSGNVLFRSGESDREKLAEAVATLIEKRFGYDLAVVVVSYRDLKRAVQKAPAGFGDEPATYLCDVIFLRPPTTAKATVKEFELKEGVDTVAAGSRVVYFSRLKAKATSSRFGRIAAKPVYAEMTIRSWKTTRKLLDLIES